MTMRRHDGRSMASTEQPEPFLHSYQNPFRLLPLPTINLIASHKKNMAAAVWRVDWRVESMVEVVGATTSSMAFTMLGDPPVQRCTRIAWRGLLGRVRQQMRRRMAARTPIIYDPSRGDKIRYRAALVAAFNELGLSDNLPYFAEGAPLQLVVKFVCPRPLHVVQAFPRRKDLDNLVKFVMDAFHDVFYGNDTVVVKITAEKAFPPVGSAGAWTEVHISTI